MNKPFSSNIFGVASFDSSQAARSLAAIDYVLTTDPDCIDSEAYYRLYLDGYSEGELDENKRLVSRSGTTVHSVDDVLNDRDSG
ncbi:MAG: hypothetical protein ACPGSM_20765 [Thiolinea sp.]